MLNLNKNIDNQTYRNMKKPHFDEILNTMWVDFNERIEVFRHFYRMQKKEIADEIGMDSRRLSLPKGSAQHTIAYLILLHYPELNAHWLLFGQGNMFNKEYEGEILRRGGHDVTIPRQYDTEVFYPDIAAEDTAKFGHPDIAKSDNDVIFNLRTELDTLKAENQTVWQRYDNAQQEIGRLKKMLLEAAHIKE